MTKLQVKINGEWLYVFCHNPRQGLITTTDKGKALLKRDMEFFQSKYADHVFRIAQ